MVHNQVRFLKPVKEIIREKGNNKWMIIFHQE